MTKLSVPHQIALLLEGERDGLTSQQIAEFFPDTKYPTISGALSNLYGQGGYRREKIAGSKAFRYFRDETATPQPVISKPRRQMAAGVRHECEQLRARVAELELWKTEAILRFPQLAVPTLVLRAREIVAEQLQECLDENGARSVLAGQRDNTTLVKAVVRALEAAE